MAAIFALCALLQSEPPEQFKIDAAVEKAAQYLIARAKEGLKLTTHFNHKDLRKREIVLYALAHAGFDDTDATFATLLKEMLADSIASNYGASTQALALEAIDRVRYQGRIAQCAQYLVDWQCKNGQWFYGGSMELPKWSDPGPRKKGTASLTVVTVRKGKPLGGATGDNSNTQYAVLGLRACQAAGVVIPRDTFEAAETWWLGAQNQDGGWDYDCFETRAEHSYGGMTAGALGSLAICRFYLKKDARRDQAIAKGVRWIAERFSVTEHPKFTWSGPEGKWYHYWLYALERAGMLLETEQFGKNAWYAPGAHELLKTQRENGSWSEEKGEPVSQTAFGILFLRRATKPLRPVATEK